MRREIRSNYRLTVTPDLRGVFPRGDHDATLVLLDGMARAARRHLDDVARVGIEWDMLRAECSFCGYEWETVTAEDLAERPEDYEGQVLGEPVCCYQAADEFRAALVTDGDAK